MVSVQICIQIPRDDSRRWSKRMKTIITIPTFMIAMSLSSMAAGTNQTAEIELRDIANVGNRLLWNNGFTRYVALHQIYVCRVLQPPDSTNTLKRWQLGIERKIRGERTGEIACLLPGVTNEVKAGTQLIVLGNDHKTGFNVIGWWFHSGKTEESIEKLTQQQCDGYSPPAIRRNDKTGEQGNASH